MEQQTLLKISGFLGIIALYALYRILTKPNKEFQSEINEILTNEKYKVKGQFDTK